MSHYLFEDLVEFEGGVLRPDPVRRVRELRRRRAKRQEILIVDAVWAGRVGSREQLEKDQVKACDGSKDS